MTVGEFLSIRLGRIVLYLSLMAATAAFLLLTGTQSGVLLLVFIVWVLLGAVCLTAEYLLRRAHLRELAAIMDGLDQKYLFFECAPKPRDPYEQALYSLMRQSGKAMLEAVSQAQGSQREYRDYIESWVHEIKTPITAAGLLCRNVEPQLRRKLAQELCQIETHVERALFYARAESPERDFLIRQTSLLEIVQQAVGRHRSLLIQNGVRIELQTLDYTIYTDGKWVCFLLGQLLQNAVRYRQDDPVITISARQLGQRVQLTVHDNGIGIPQWDLPRIFERGFTGSNGRLRGGSTGMGLYLCRRLAEFLQLELQISSSCGQGTSVLLTFPARDTLTKL